MNCYDYLKEMLVFDLLDNSTQAKLKAHLRTCSTCQAEWVKVEKITEQFIGAHVLAITAENPTQLTDRIMTRVIELERNKNIPSSSKTWIFNSFMRLGLTGLSFCLVALFASEFTAPLVHDMNTPVVGSQKTVLQGDWLRIKLSNRKESSFNRQPCLVKNTNVDMACLKANWHRITQTINNKY